MKAPGLVLVFFLGLAFANGATYVVTTTADSGAGSLRQAILDANANANADTIEFSISPAGLQVITPLSPLPVITNTVHINGRTQPGYAVKPVIQIDGIGAGIGNGLWISNTFNCVIEGLCITRFKRSAPVVAGNGIRIDLGGFHQIKGNFLGLKPSGAATDGNEDAGICVAYSHDNVIGGTTADDRNFIAGNGGSLITLEPHDMGIHIGGLGCTNNVVRGNFIGTDFTGTAALGNHGNGITISHDASDNLVGGLNSPEANVIAASQTGSGIGFRWDTKRNRVQGNLIGTDLTGLLPLGNAQSGIAMMRSDRNLIGGPVPEARNIISGNGQDGITITNHGVTGCLSNVIQGNFIGMDITGSSPMPNSRDGIWAEFVEMSANLVGGTNSPDEANVIAHNGRNGITIVQGDGCAILGNSIFSNTDLGIDLAPNEVTLGATENDAGDGDFGGNLLQNFPVVTNAFSDSYNTVIEGRFNGAPNVPFRLQFFWGYPCDPNNHGEGQHYLGQTSITTDNTGNRRFTATLTGGVPPGQALTATATSTNGSTSEFSICGEVTVPPGLSITTTSSGTVTIFWSASLGPWILQRSPSITPPAWSDDPNPAVLIGSTWVVTEPGIPGGFYYRLRSP